MNRIICIQSESRIRSLQALSEYGGQVIYKQYAYSYNYLQSVTEAISPVMADYGIFKVGINAELNQVVIDKLN